MLVIGSQAIIGSHPELLQLEDDRRDAIAGSLVLDVMPLDGSDHWVNALSWMTDGGTFADSNDGAHADPVAEGVATLPSGWRDRLIQFETANMIAPNGLQAPKRFRILRRRHRDWGYRSRNADQPTYNHSPRKPG